MAGPGGFMGFALNQNYFIFINNFQKNYQAKLTNPPPPYGNLNPYQVITGIYSESQQDMG